MFTLTANEEGNKLFASQDVVNDTQPKTAIFHKNTTNNQTFHKYYVLIE